MYLIKRTSRGEMKVGTNLQQAIFEMKSTNEVKFDVEMCKKTFRLTWHGNQSSRFQPIYGYNFLLRLPSIDCLRFYCFKFFH